MAAPRPNGTATISAITVVQSVPTSNGTTPNDAGLKRGAQRVPVKKSTTETCRKNSIAGVINDQAIPAVIKIVKNDAEKSTLRIIRSPIRFDPDFKMKSCSNVCGELIIQSLQKWVWQVVKRLVGRGYRDDANRHISVPSFIPYYLLLAKC